MLDRERYERKNMKIYLLGASNPETIRVINSIINTGKNIKVLGFLDNDKTKHGSSFHGYTIIGGLEKVDEISTEKDVYFVNIITGNTLSRFETTREIVQRGGKLTNLIHKSVDVSMTKWGVGNYVQEYVVVQAGVSIGDNSSIHASTVIGHETMVGNSVFIAHATSISGCCEIGDGTFVGTNATILPRVKVGRWCVIGAGAVVTKDVPDYTVSVGNPARVIRDVDVVYENGRVM